MPEKLALSVDQCGGSGSLAELPPRGIGLLVIDERAGLAWRRSHFSRTFRELARASGWPDGIWNMDSRAGVASEAFEAGGAGRRDAIGHAHADVNDDAL
ncbi:hypothetical protein MZTS_23375 [Methylorubrum zatmanii]|nr:hypothetical protein [Methylorubrum zatmanii]